MRALRERHAQERDDLVGKTEVEMRALRVVVCKKDRLAGQAPRYVFALAPLGADAVRHGMLPLHAQEGHEGVLGAVAHSPHTGEAHDVVFLDGIWIGRDAVVLIACTREHVLAWHLAEREYAGAWAAHMLRTPAPAIAATDGRPRLREGGASGVARHVRPALRLPRLLLGEEVHHEPTEARLRRRALLPRPPPAQGEGGRCSGGLPRELCRMVLQMGAVFAGVLLEGRAQAVRPREAEEGEARPE